MTDFDHLSGVYGAPPTQLAQTHAGAHQLSPLSPGAHDLGAANPGAYARITMLAPPSTLERRYVLAQALTALAPGGELIAMAPKESGGLRIAKELTAFGCDVDETSKSHHRICVAQRPEVLEGVDDALATGGPQLVAATELWSQPGVFSWDRTDPGSALLATRLPALRGHGADLGCGIGVLSLRVLQSPNVKRLDLIDIDRRAIEAARRNIADPRAHLHWADAAADDGLLGNLDFIVMNPPFHAAGAEDKALGQAFIRRAAKALHSGGVCWLVANRHLPYEAALGAAFKAVRLDHEADGFKIYEARA